MIPVEICDPFGRKIVCKANELTEAKLIKHASELNAQDQSIITAFLSLINPKKAVLKQYRITTKGLSKMVGIRHSDLMKDLKESCKRIRSSSITVVDPKNPKDWLITGWFSEAQYIHDEGVIEFSPSIKLMPYLYDLKSHYTKYNLQCVLGLKGKHSIKVYELLRRQLTLKSSKTSRQFEVALTNFREFLGLKEGQYFKLAMFVKYVLKPIQTEISEKTDLSFNYSYERTGRKVTKLLITVNKQVMKQPDSKKSETKPENSTARTQIMETLVNAIPETGCMEGMLSLYSDNHIMEAMSITLGAAASGKIKSDRLAYFIKTLNRLHQTPIQEPEQPKNKRSTREQLMDTSWADDDWFEHLDDDAACRR